jgi:hypothetical protein
MKFRRVFVSFLLSLLLLICFVGVAAADSTPTAEPTGTATSSACFAISPEHQKVTVGQNATLNFYGYHKCPIQPDTDVKINIAWGDGSTSTISLCTGEVCPEVLPQASHAYTTTDTYYPRACIDIPSTTWFAPPCLTAQVDVTE